MVHFVSVNILIFNLEPFRKTIVSSFIITLKNSNEFLTFIQKMSSEMEEMNAGVSECTAEINRVNKSGGSGTASFIRKQSKKVAEHIETFSKQLKIHNIQFDFRS